MEIKNIAIEHINEKIEKYKEVKEEENKQIFSKVFDDYSNQLDERENPLATRVSHKNEDKFLDLNLKSLKQKKDPQTGKDRYYINDGAYFTSKKNSNKSFGKKKGSTYYDFKNWSLVVAPGTDRNAVMKYTKKYYNTDTDEDDTNTGKYKTSKNKTSKWKPVPKKEIVKVKVNKHGKVKKEPKFFMKKTGKNSFVQVPLRKGSESEE